MGKTHLDDKGELYEQFQLIDENTGYFHDEFLDAIRKILNGYLHGQLTKKEFHVMWIQIYVSIVKMIDTMHEELEKKGL